MGNKIETFFVGGACGKGKRTSGNSSCQHSEFSWNLKYSMKSHTFSWAREIDFRYETKARKVIVDFKLDALYRYVSIESLLKSGSKKC